MVKWREAATLMLVRRTLKQSTSYPIKAPNFEVLLLERSSKSTFMPSAYVFPGGVVSDIDFSKKWHRLLEEGSDLLVRPESGSASQKKSTFDNGERTNFGLPNIKVRPDMLIEDRPGSISRDVAFRLCALRETFEECGILLYKSLGDDSTDNNNKQKEEIHKWREKVQRKPGAFLSMCEQLQIVPDIWSTHEWSNWLTPLNLDKHTNRFDTMFYITFIEEHVDVLEDDKEVVAAKWKNPAEVLDEHYTEKLWLAPPQVYELSRMCNEELLHYDNFCYFAKVREELGSEQWLPVRINCANGVIAVLPGDDMFPGQPHKVGWDGPPSLNMTVADASSMAEKLHRTEIHSRHKMLLKCTINPAFGHKRPITWPK